MFGLFKKLAKQDIEIEQPIVGSQYQFVSKDDSPRPNKSHTATVVVTEVKDGWVRYDSGFMKDERAEVKSFMNMYRRVEWNL